jgi:hypothetical protein
MLKPIVVLLEAKELVALIKPLDIDIDIARRLPPRTVVVLQEAQPNAMKPI